MFILSWFAPLRLPTWQCPISLEKMDLKIPKKFLPSRSLSLLNSCSSSLPASSFTLQLITSSLPPPHRDMQLYYCLAAHIVLSLQPAIIGNRSLFLLGCMVTRVSVSSDIPTPANFPPHLHSTERRQESVTVDVDSDSSTQTDIPLWCTQTADYTCTCIT